MTIINYSYSLLGRLMMIMIRWWRMRWLPSSSNVLLTALMLCEFDRMLVVGTVTVLAPVTVIMTVPVVVTMSMFMTRSVRMSVPMIMRIRPSPLYTAG